MSTDSWICPEIPNTRKEHIANLHKYLSDVSEFYPKIYQHAETLNLHQPSPLPISLGLIDQYNELIMSIDRGLLQVYIYVNYIRLNHISKQLKTTDTDKIMTLLNSLTEQRRSLGANFPMVKEFLELMSDRKDKDMEFYLPYLAFSEKKLFKCILIGLMGVQMICQFVIKHLEESNIFCHQHINIESAYSGSY